MSRHISEALQTTETDVDAGALTSGFAVLMAVYHGDKAEYFEQSLQSVFAQTLLPNQCVLVCDGRLTDDLERIIRVYVDAYPDIMDVVRTSSEQNQGLGRALALGLKHCRYELIARMDSDDICVPHRFATQVAYMQEHPEIDMLSSKIIEFCDSPDSPIGYRHFGATHDELSRHARSRNPINHPAVVFRKSTIESVGGYVHFPLLEDYHLIARLLVCGAQLASLSESLLYFRATPDTYERRRGWKYLQREVELQRYFRSIGFISLPRFLWNIALRIPVRMMPAKLLRRLYREVLRGGMLG